MPRTATGRGCRHAPLTTEEKRRRAAERDKRRKRAPRPRTAEQKEARVHKPRSEEQKAARRLREGKTVQPSARTTAQGGHVSPVNERLELGRGIRRGAHRDPAATMRSDGLYSGDGYLLPDELYTTGELGLLTAAQQVELQAQRRRREAAA